MASFKSDLEQLEVLFEQWGKRLEALVNRAEEISPGDRVDFGRRVAALQAKHRAASRTRDALEAADNETDVKADGKWNEVESTFFKSN